MTIRLNIALFGLGFLVCMAAWAGGKTEDSGQGVNVDGQNRALFGRDAVAYFSLETDAQAVEGKPEFSFGWNGAEWLFATRENLQSFESDPHKYAPRYGGYCSFAMSQDKLIFSDPEAWTLYDGKLFLFNRKPGRTNWRNDSDRFIALADGYWPARLERLRAADTVK